MTLDEYCTLVSHAINKLTVYTYNQQNMVFLFIIYSNQRQKPNSAGDNNKTKYILYQQYQHQRKNSYRTNVLEPQHYAIPVNTKFLDSLQHTVIQ